MSTRTSSLRLGGRAPAIGAALVVALAAPPAAISATGTPMPTPDDPPPTYRATGTKSSGGAGTSGGTKPARLAESAVPIPTPDAPLVATAVPSVTKSSPAPDASTATPRVASSPAGTTYAGSGPVAAPRAVRSARDARPKPVPKPKAKPARVKAKATPGPRRAAVPRDAVRLGLPVGVLAPRAPASDMSASLLLAAALLLTGAAAGSLVLGIVARSATRHA